MTDLNLTHFSYGKKKFDDDIFTWDATRKILFFQIGVILYIQSRANSEFF